MLLRSNMTDAMDDVRRVSKETATLYGSTADTSKRIAFSISKKEKEKPNKSFFLTLKIMSSKKYTPTIIGLEGSYARSNDFVE